VSWWNILWSNPNLNSSQIKIVLPFLLKMFIFIKLCTYKHLIYGNGYDNETDSVELIYDDRLIFDW